ncbi:tRNA pseudouridine(38-40) synthase TruA [Uliginosibacterium sp. 31-16]|uniref:tRNA pseudouridine(38-40) synthase TruA n=1 Tax=Uliginosibacterium sp. 31-16 TaxID=3068315 RepID=UPI00273FD434|nr:tRNA pseudouridine(38-40) synthase TruA [Uliginosibacterium sp. 31-16]MDP5239797.1 tRNA pseudouridine(38-40) synthase TruA [Uliginosibacterium sp. 31-16]
MVRIALGVEYCGAGFEGWQSQTHGRTVQDVLETAIGSIANEKVGVVCAGRTDTGVHAAVQVAHFDTRAERPVTAWVRGVNAHLPDGIAVTWARETDERFHARFSALSRRYRYVLLNRPVRSALLNGRVGWFHAPLDIAVMQQAARLLVGRHDFSAFRAAQCQANSPVRDLRVASVLQHGEWFVFDFEANAFLHHMIRNLVGALIHVGKGAQPPGWMGELLEQRNRRLSPPTFMPDGLYLAGVEYPDGLGLPDGGRIAAPLFLPAGM